MNTFGSSRPQQGTVYTYLLADPKGKTLLVDLCQPAHPVSLIQSGLPNSVIGLATFSTCQVQDYLVAAATEIVGRPLVPIKSHVKVQVQCREWHTFSCPGSLVFWD